jgi:serine protease AprX
VSGEPQPQGAARPILPSVVRASADLAALGATGEGIVWAVVGSGIHAAHRHFEQHRNLSLPAPLRHRDFTDPSFDDTTSEMEALVDPLGHGTHAAGIIAGELRGSSAAPLIVDRRLRGEENTHTLEEAAVLEVSGFAPRCRVVSVKVLDDRGTGRASDVIAALAWIREVNARARGLVIHGVTLGVGYPYDAEWFACGQSPICVEVNETVRSGVVVVAAAGNTGFGHQQTLAGVSMHALAMSINDPGNAEHAITVGSTHEGDPQKYGVSYFSSKGPTADGRLKPDLVAPGERMISCAPDRGDQSDHGSRGLRYREETGTSSAAAYVSGVAAALLSARRELIGQPLAVKQLLMATAEDLQRDRCLQGRGLVSLARALAESRAPAAYARRAAAEQIAPVAAAAPAAPLTPVAPAAANHGSSTGKRFAVALSFPGERREYVQKVVWALRHLGVPREAIFYDRFFTAELARPNMDSWLQSIYHDDSELIVVFLSKEYENKEWCGLEWRAIRDILKERSDDTVMTLRFDDTKVPGSFSIDGYVDLRNVDPEQVADLIQERLAFNRRRRPA